MGLPHSTKLARLYKGPQAELHVPQKPVPGVEVNLQADSQTRDGVRQARTGASEKILWPRWESNTGHTVRRQMCVYIQDVQKALYTIYVDASLKNSD